MPAARTADLSESSAWAVSRISLRARNQLSAIPDNWESDVLAQFDQRQLAGDPVQQLNVAAVVDGEFRYMEAQAAGPLCLACHSSEINSEVQSVLSPLLFALNCFFLSKFAYKSLISVAVVMWGLNALQSLYR